VVLDELRILANPRYRTRMVPAVAVPVAEIAVYGS